MSWLKIDDGFVKNPKVRPLTDRAFRLHVTGLCMCARDLTDGYVSAKDAKMLCIEISATRRHIDELVSADLWLPAAGGGFSVKDYLEYNPSADYVKAQRAAAVRRQKLVRNTHLKDALRARDKDRCRYCNVEVSWADRRGPNGATYDHVDPFGDDSLGNIVVACRGCNSSKGRRTPDQAGMPLLPEPSDVSKTFQVRHTTPSPPVFKTKSKALAAPPRNSVRIDFAAVAAKAQANRQALDDA